MHAALHGTDTGQGSSAASSLWAEPAEMTLELYPVPTSRPLTVLFHVSTLVSVCVCPGAFLISPLLSHSGSESWTLLLLLLGFPETSK